MSPFLFWVVVALGVSLPRTASTGFPKASVQLHELPKVRLPLPPLPMRSPLPFAAPQPFLQHPTPQRFDPQFNPVLVREVLPRQGRPKPLPRFSIIGAQQSEFEQSEFERGLSNEFEVAMTGLRYASLFSLSNESAFYTIRST